MATLEDKVLDVFRENKNICAKCEENRPERHKSLKRHGPLSFFNIGDDFAGDDYKILFVGKNTWYDQTDVKELKEFSESKFRDCRDDGRDMFEHNCSPFWRCIREITFGLHDNKEKCPQCRKPSRYWDYDKLWERIALTNLTKCNTSSDYSDTTPYYFTEQCMKLFEREVEEIKPTHLILFVGDGYDSLIKELSFIKKNPKVNDTGYRQDKEWVNLGEKKVKVWWWEEVFDVWGKKLFFLRTRHPQGAPMKEFADKIAVWIQKSKA